MGRRSLIGIAVLCALAFSAFAAANASAAQRAFTCSHTATGFTDAHCLTGGGAAFGHVTIPDNTTTTITGTNEKTASNTTASTTWKLRGELVAVLTEVQCTGAHGHGTLINRAVPANHVEGEGTIEYTGCTVTAPAGKGCLVTGGTIITTQLSATTEGRAAGTLHFKPASGTVMAEVPISGCAKEVPPANSYLVTGEFTAQVSGATITTTIAQTRLDNELRFGGVKAGIEGALTVDMAEGSTPNVTAGEGIVLT